LRPAKLLQPFLGRLQPPVFFLGPPETALPVARCPARRSPAPASWGHRACRAFDRGALPSADPTPSGNPYRPLTHIADRRLGRRRISPQTLQPSAGRSGSNGRVRAPSNLPFGWLLSVTHWMYRIRSARSAAPRRSPIEAGRSGRHAPGVDRIRRECIASAHVHALIGMVNRGLHRPQGQLGLPDKCYAAFGNRPCRVCVPVDNEFARCGAAQNGQFWRVMAMSLLP